MSLEMSAPQEEEKAVVPVQRTLSAQAAADQPRYRADEENDEETNLHRADEDARLKPGISALSSMLGFVCCPLTWCCGFYTLQPNEEAVEIHYGQYTGKNTTPGFHNSSCWGREIRKVSTRQQSIDLPAIKILDSSGSPLMVSAVLVYRFKDAERAALSVQNSGIYVMNQATATLRKIVSRFPYETPDNSPSLRTHQHMVARELAQVAQRQLFTAGVEVISFQINELSYAPEIAAAMLKRQQAEALLAARHTLVNGAVQIALDAVGIVERSGITMGKGEKARLVNNVLTVTCSEGSEQ